MTRELVHISTWREREDALYCAAQWEGADDVAFFCCQVSSVDVSGKKLNYEGGDSLSYDTLLLATGST